MLTRGFATLPPPRVSIQPLTGVAIACGHCATGVPVCAKRGVAGLSHAKHALSAAERAQRDGEGMEVADEWVMKSGKETCG